MNIVEKLGITAGPWKVHHLGKHWNNPDLEDYEIHWSDDGECICDTVYKKEDADLCAAAPEMLEALIDLIIDAINDKYNELHPRYSRNRTDEWIERHATDYFQSEINVIQKATGKSWEEIKELL